MGERLPGSMQAAARAAFNLGLTQEDTTQALFKAMEQGKLMAEEFLPEFSKELMKSANSGGALERAMNSTGAAFGRFRTNVFMANKIFNEAGFDRGVRRLLNTTSDAIMRSDALWRFLGQAAESLADAFRGPMELAGALGERFQSVEKFAESLGLQTNELLAIFGAFFKIGRRILFLFWLLPAAMSGVGKIIDGENLTWAEWAVTIGGVAAALAGTLKILKKIRTARANLGMGGAGGNTSTTSSPGTSGNQSAQGSGKSGVRKMAGRFGKAAIITSAGAALLDLLKGGEIIGGDGWSVRAPDMRNIGQVPEMLSQFHQRNQFPAMLGPHGGVQQGQLPFGQVNVDRIDIRVEGGGDARETAEQTYLIFKDEVRRAATSDPILEK